MVRFAEIGNLPQTTVRLGLLSSALGNRTATHIVGAEFAVLYWYATIEYNPIYVYPSRLPCRCEDPYYYNTRT